MPLEKCIAVHWQKTTGLCQFKEHSINCDNSKSKANTMFLRVQSVPTSDTKVNCAAVKP